MKRNQTMRRGLSVLLALVLCLSLLPATALAEGTATTNQTADFTDGDGRAALTLLRNGDVSTADWDSESNTLTLKGVDFTTTASTAVKLPADATIVLANGTTNTIASVCEEADRSYGIHAYDGLTIQGSGTLTVRSARATTGEYSNSSGIYAYDGDITITGGTIEATGGESCMYSCGIYANGGGINITDGTVIAASGTANAYSYGICLSGKNTITISGGAVNATGGISNTYSGGIGAGNVIIYGGTVTATGGQSSGESYGICADEGLVEISGGVVTATGSTADFGSYGIWAIRVDISGGHVIARTQAEASAGTRMALGVEPNLSSYSSYYWRTSSEASFTNTTYEYSDTDTYVEFSSQKTITTYTVTFDANGGTLNKGSHSSIKPEADGTVDYLAAATREGYTFDGWYTEADGGEKVYTYVTVFTADTTVYAHWTPAAQTKQITEASFAMKGYTLGANAEDIVITSNTEGLSLAGGYFEGLGQPYSYLIGVVSGDDYDLITGPLEAGKAYILMLKADVNAGYDVGSGVTEDNVTLNGTITADDCSELKAESTLGITFVLPVLKEGGGSNSSSNTTVTPAEPEITTDGGTTVAGIETGVTTSGTTSTATVSQDTLEKAVEAAESAAGQANTNAAVEIAVETPAQATEVKVDLPAEGLESFAGSEAQSLIISSGVGAVTISDQAAASIAGQAHGDTVTVTISAVTQPEKILNERQLAAVGDAPVYDLSITSSGTYISQFGGGSVTVSLPYTLKEDQAPNGVVVYYVDDLGNIQRVQATYDEETQSIIFTTNHFSLYMVRYEANAAAAARFTDVPFDAYYQSAVGWAVNQGITTGTTATTFSPDASCTRAQIVTFLWRAAGSHKVSGSNPFSDVSADAYYYDAVLWAVEKGITSGTSATTFAPDATVTRGQTVTFLYRAAGSPAASGSGFSDVSSDAYYADAVAWAVQQNITTGTGNGQFSPDADCTRAQIVTFLYRAMGE